MEKPQAAINTVDQGANASFPKKLPSPTLLFVGAIAAIFVAEMAVMGLLSSLPPLPAILSVLLGASLLVALLTLPLYLLFWKPMVVTIAGITEHRALEEKYRSLSLTDDLTGLYNRRGFFSLADHTLKVASENQKGFTLLYADIDNLKEINDSRGHEGGNAALVNVARILMANYRQSDIVARIGGDEFIAILLETGKETVDTVISRLRIKLELHNAGSDDGSQARLSVGTAHFDPCAPRSRSIDDLLDEADKKMYEEKRRKKNFRHRSGAAG